LIIGKSVHSSIAENTPNPPIPGKEEEKRLRKKTKTKRQKGPSKVKFLEQVEDCACAEESCKRSDPKLSDERAAQLGWTGPPDNARYDDENDREGPGVALLESEATSTEADYVVDNSSEDEDIPDVRLSAMKQKVLRERRLSQRPNTHPDMMSREESRHDDRHGRLLEQIEKMFGGREATMRVAEEIREAYDSKIAKDKPRAISARQHIDPPSGSIMSWLDGTDDDSRRRRENNEHAEGHSSMSKTPISTSVDEIGGITTPSRGKLNYKPN
jgi:hypothetical protein